MPRDEWKNRKPVSRQLDKSALHHEKELNAFLIRALEKAQGAAPKRKKRKKRRNKKQDNSKFRKYSSRKQAEWKILDGGTYVCIGNQIIPKSWPNFDSITCTLSRKA